MENDPTKRFSARVEYYARYRPSYPAALISWLVGECGLSPASCVADVASGTGILSRLLLDVGCQVWGVEPNEGMRAAAEQLLAGHARFHSVNGRAEATTLPDARIDIVTVGQAFHWFDPPLTRAEFRRILVHGGWVVMVWNERLTPPGFLAEYEAMLQRISEDYARVDHRQFDDAKVTEFFEHDRWRRAVFPNSRDLDWESLRGRFLSASYAPTPESPKYSPAMDELKALFDRYQQHGRITMIYETKAYAGQLAG